MTSRENFSSCAVTIQRPASELFHQWENPGFLPSILRHLHGRFEAEESFAPQHGSAGVPMLVLIQRVEGRLLEWVASVGHEVLYHAVASFRPAPGGRGTELRFNIELPDETGPVRRTFDMLRGKDPIFLIREDLRNFKQYMETGEYPTTRGQSSGRRSLRGRALTSLLGEKLQRELSIGGAQLRPLVGHASAAGVSA